LEEEKYVLIKEKKEVHMDPEQEKHDLERDLDLFQLKPEKLGEKLEVIRVKRELHMDHELEKLVQERDFGEGANVFQKRERR
jgi:hypothetical protein